MESLLPNESDCCNSGCTPCILNIFDAELQKSSNKKITNYNNCIFADTYTQFHLIARENLSEDTLLLTFSYEGTDENIYLKYDPGQYFILKAKDAQGSFSRSYTPLNFKYQNGKKFEIIFKLYEEGRMSRWIQRIKLGKDTLWRGPYGNGCINFNKYKNRVFFAQGTGISPIFSVIYDLVNDDTCESILHLFYCCGDAQHIFLREELYNLGHFWNFTYEIFVNTQLPFVKKYNETVYQHRMTADDILNIKNLSSSLQILVCGSINFSENIKAMVLSMGIKTEEIHVF